MRPRLAVIVAAICGSGLCFPPPLPAQSGGDEELNQHLAAIRRQLEDLTLEVTMRERIALEMASTLDRAAGTAPSAEARRARLGEAAALLDEFGRKNPKHPQEWPFRLQAAIYLWAQARSWSQQWEDAPTDAKAREQAVAVLDGALARLRALQGEVGARNDVIAQNVRFRLAQAVADRAGFEPDGSPGRRRLEEEALALLDRPITEPSLQGYAQLLRGELLMRLGRGLAARSAWEAASKSNPPPDAASLLDLQVSVLLDEKQFDAAIKAIDASKADAASKDLRKLRVFLAQRDGLSGPARSQAEASAFRLAAAIRASGKGDPRRAVILLAGAIEAPDADQPPEAWDALAEGFLALGDAAKASDLLTRGAGRAEDLGRHEQAAGLLLRAGAALFRAGRYREADPILGKVADDPKAGDARPRASLLRALARGRALAVKAPGASLADYLAALRSHVREFRDDPSTGEARWLLGRAEAASGDRVAAEKLWKEIPPGHPRWLEARLSLIRKAQEDLDTQLLNGDLAAARARYRDARTLCDDSVNRAKTDAERDELRLATARLELTPRVGHADAALALAEGVEKTVGQSTARETARQIRLVALSALNRFLEAEQLARVEVKQATLPTLIESARLLDELASGEDSDLRMRRIGLILRVLASRVLELSDHVSPPEKAAARIRLSRALLFSGDAAGARRALGDGSVIGPDAPDELLRDLADLYGRLDAHELALDAQRLRLQKSAPGSLPWLDARYGLALALYRSGKADEARRLVEATAILHPEFGGGELSQKFERLRQRLKLE